MKSITVTGHSLGGALASLCGYDLSTAVSEARGITKPAQPDSEAEYSGRDELVGALLGAV